MASFHTAFALAAMTGSIAWRALLGHRRPAARQVLGGGRGRVADLHQRFTFGDQPVQGPLDLIAVDNRLFEWFLFFQAEMAIGKRA